MLSQLGQSALKEALREPNSYAALRRALEDSKGKATIAFAKGDFAGAVKHLEALEAAEEARVALGRIGGPDAIALARKNLERAAAKTAAAPAMPSGEPAEGERRRQKT